MIALAAANLGYRCHVYAPEADSIAADVCAGFTCAGWDDAEALAGFDRAIALANTPAEAAHIRQHLDTLARSAKEK